MGAKEFLMPNVKKIVVFIATYMIIMPLLLCINSEVNCQQTPGGWLGCSCVSAFNTVSIYPVQYLYLIAFGLFSFTGYFAVLWLGVIISYILACIIVYFWWGGSNESA